MEKQAEEIWRRKCRFLTGYRYELFYSLGTLLDPNARIHPKWRARAKARLGKDFDALLTVIGGAWEVFPVISSLLPGELAEPHYDEIKDYLQSMPIAQFREKILRGLLHSDPVVDTLLTGSQDLKAAMAKAPKAKQEWLAHIGLYPYSASSPLAIALGLLLKHPKRFRETMLKILDLYWAKVFLNTWEQLLPQLRRSQEANERLFLSCSFAEFARQSLLRVEVNENKGELQAIRGGYRLKFRTIERCYFLPSVFNDRRFWSAFDDADGRTSVYFPCFDPNITLDIQLAGTESQLSEPPLDPALIFKALGDSTRFAIASLLARSPTSSVELAKTLSVSKPTISHHVHLLREAGLLEEAFASGSVELSLKRSVIERLSELTVRILFENEKPVQLQRTRPASP